MMSNPKKVSITNREWMLELFRALSHEGKESLLAELRDQLRRELKESERVELNPLEKDSQRLS